MTVLKKYDRHAALVDRMASAVGVDMDEAIQRGELSAADIHAGVQRCVGCSNVADCEHWLDGQGAGADATPGYCRNAGLFRGLKK